MITDITTDNNDEQTSDLSENNYQAKKTTHLIQYQHK